MARPVLIGNLYLGEGHSEKKRTANKIYYNKLCFYITLFLLFSANTFHFAYAYMGIYLKTGNKKKIIRDNVY